jgi:ABC-type multidrug transport system ATPase subunit
MHRPVTDTNIVSVLWNNLRNRRKADRTIENKYDKSTAEKIITLITDEPTLKGALDFGKYSRLLANIIANSPPRFSVGVFGGWGTGKTTLMRTTIKSYRKIVYNSI